MTPDEISEMQQTLKAMRGYLGETGDGAPVPPPMRTANEERDPIRFAGKCPSGMEGYDAVTAAQEGRAAIEEYAMPQPAMYDSKGLRCVMTETARSVKPKRMTNKSSVVSQARSLSAACAALHKIMLGVGQSEMTCDQVGGMGMNSAGRDAMCETLTYGDGNPRCAVEGDTCVATPAYTAAYTAAAAASK